MANGLVFSLCNTALHCMCLVGNGLSVCACSMYYSAQVPFQTPLQAVVCCTSFDHRENAMKTPTTCGGVTPRWPQVYQLPADGVSYCPSLLLPAPFLSNMRHYRTVLWLSIFCQPIHMLDHVQITTVVSCIFETIIYLQIPHRTMLHLYVSIIVHLF